MKRNQSTKGGPTKVKVGKMAQKIGKKARAAKLTGDNPKLWSSNTPNKQ